MATPQDDQYKAEGKLTFKIENFNEFARQPADAHRENGPIFIRGIPWKIWVRKRKSAPEWIDVYLFCTANPTNSAWSCEASYSLKVLAQKEGNAYLHRTSNHVFCKKNNAQAISRKYEELLHPGNGWYNLEEDTITVEVDVKAKIPCGFKFDLGEQWYRVQQGCIAELLKTGHSSVCTIECFLSYSHPLASAKLHANKNVLASHSDVFRAMFMLTNGGMKESKESRVVVEDSPARTIEHMLQYMYTGRLPADFKAEEDAAELLEIADKYQIEPLAVHCEELLLNSLAVANVCHRLELADRHNAHSLKIACGEMIRKNLVAVKKQQEWKSLKDLTPKLLVDILEELVI